MDNSYKRASLLHCNISYESKKSFTALAPKVKADNYKSSNRRPGAITINLFTAVINSTS